MISINLKNVSKQFGQTVAVSNVSLQIEAGELFFLLGPSGCGKTTLLRTIAGLCELDEGEIRFNDRRVEHVAAHKRNAAMVFQNYALWPHMTVAENVAYGLKERRISKERCNELVAQALKSVHMDGYGERTPNQLSGGQQQRIALARALVIEPDAVLLDEPLSNLDAKLRLEMRREIRRIHTETGITMVYVTHDQKEALSMADRIAVMSMGAVEQVGDPRTLYRRPRNRFVAEFVGETNLISGTLLNLNGMWAEVGTGIGKVRARVGTARVSEGDTVVCMVRPECLSVDASHENAFKARVSNVVYLGDLEELLLEADGTTLRALVGNPGEFRVTEGTELQVSFAAEDAVLLPANLGGSAT